MSKTINRRFAFMLIIALLFSLSTTTAFAAQGSMDNFVEKSTYSEGYFSDIGGQWFESSVARGYALGLIDGKGGGIFDPAGSVTLAEAIKLAACLHSIYYTGSADFEQGSPWYQVYVNYCLTKGIISSGYSDYNAAATRAQFASIFASALPSAALSAINTVNDDCIPDVKISDSYGPAVYKLYRAGILTGSDSRGTFNPQSNIQRSEMAAIVTRMADIDLRREITLTEKISNSGLSAQEIFTKCSAAVFYIEIYDINDNPIGSGSGVFTSSDGQAVTNYHVIENAYSAAIMTTDGNTYSVDGVYDYDENTDLARLQIHGSGFSYLPIGDSRSLSTGATVFAIGSPLGLDNTISQGIISNAGRVIDGISYIQTTAPISPGSSGGALINDKGELIGITSAYFADGQNLNLAVPIHRLEELGYQSWKPLSSLHTIVNATYYSGYYPTPDFGAMAGISPYYTENAEDGRFYLYREIDITDVYTALDDYETLLYQCGFSYLTAYVDDDVGVVLIYRNGTYCVSVSLNEIEYNGYSCLMIGLYAV